MNEENNEKRKISMSIPKKYSIALGLSAAVLALFAVAAVRLSAPNAEAEDSETTATVDSEAEAKLNDVPDTRTAETTETETETVQFFDAAQSEEEPTENVQAAAETEGTTRSAPDSFILPLGTNMGSDYSAGALVYNEVLSEWRTHDGVDFYGAYGDGVKAIADGVVKDVYDDALFGTVEVIDHGGGITAYYCGLDSETVLNKGEIVSIGDKIGEVGEVPCENAAEYPHLHLEIRVDGVLADPLEVMGFYE
ncbi:MAG: M23 family metallopeptidase [Clostridiales bacterium]|nr:M23 family metallopeptidase [Clostridiales bacterium]MCD7827086.1 M23 family metallopeptidase [Clostridiales bacterium]